MAAASTTWNGLKRIPTSHACFCNIARLVRLAHFVSSSGSSRRCNDHHPRAFGDPLATHDAGIFLHKYGQHLAMHWRTHQPAFVLVAGFGKTRVTQAHFGLPTVAQHENSIRA